MRPVPLLLLAAGCTLAEPPTCEDTEIAACFTGTFRTLLGERASGVEVCTPDLPDIACVTADADGAWKLPGLPLDTDVLVTATYGDAVDTVFPQSTSMAWYAWYKVMVPRSIMNTNASNLGVELDPAKGNVLFIVWEGLNLDGVDTDRVPDVTARIVEDDAAGAVFYGNALGLASRSATATTSNGSGGVLNLDPGVWTLSFDAPGGPCEDPMFHWAYTAPNEIPVPVRAGMTTAIDVMCPP
ncbi:MAG: hypothetical protein H6733_11855 [Alphaproteobacteria bacterium]|nr:hypothetical protein [Alphaproteobacteria bacterium]